MSANTSSSSASSSSSTGGAWGQPFRDEENAHMITEINVTPLVDITLVLLIIFMVTTTYIVNPSIKVDLPRAASATEQMKTRLALTVDAQGVLFLNGEASSDDSVRKFIATELPGTPDLQAIIAADKGVTHGRVVQLIDLVKRSGVRKFAINVDRGLGEAPEGPASPASPAGPAAEEGPAAPQGDVPGGKPDPNPQPTP